MYFLRINKSIDQQKCTEIEDKYKLFINEYTKYENTFHENWFTKSSELVEKFTNDSLIVNLINSKKINLNFFEEVKKKSLICSTFLLLLIFKHSLDSLFFILLIYNYKLLIRVNHVENILIIKISFVRKI